MQTFLPYPDFQESAKVLDRQRLGKQRVECLQILHALLGRTQGWINHPATKMWRGHEGWLVDYADAICAEWIRRGYKDTVRLKLLELRSQAWKIGPDRPPWLGDAEFHRSHRSNLLRKAPELYRDRWPNERADMEYVWPV